jgi:uncharacterized membrane protein
MFIYDKYEKTLITLLFCRVSYFHLSDLFGGASVVHLFSFLWFVFVLIVFIACLVPHEQNKNKTEKTKQMNNTGNKE